MLGPVECILDGTWASGEWPGEYEDYFLMRHMGWSTEDVQAASPYQRRFCRDFLLAEMRARANASG